MQGHSSSTHAASFAQDYFAPSHPIQYIESQPTIGDASRNISRPKAALKRSRNDSPRPEDAAASRRDALEIIESSGESEPDRKRNKLAYQRSTIACVHCRRRKIRCVMPKSDESQTGESQTGKCAHCTRMKKNCSFVPVDQTVAKSKKRSETLSKPISEPEPASKARKESVAIDHERLFNYGATDLSYAGLIPSHHGTQSTRQRSATCSDAPIYYPGMDAFQPLSGSQDKPRSASLHGPEVPLFYHESMPLQHTRHITPAATVWNQSPSPILPAYKDTSSFHMPDSDAFAPNLSRLPDVYLNNTIDGGQMLQSLSANAEAHSLHETISKGVDYRSNTMPTPHLTFVAPFDQPGLLNTSTITSDPFNTLPFDGSLHNLSTSAAYLSPITTSSGPSSKSISPMPQSDAYLSPPTSEPTHLSRSQVTPSMLTPGSLTEGLYDYSSPAGLDFTSDESFQQFKTMSLPLPYGNQEFQGLQADKIQLLEQQQLLDMMFTATTGFEQQGYTATSGPEDLGLYVQP